MSKTILDTFSHFGVEMKIVSAREGLRAYYFELEMVTPVRMKVIEGFLEDLKYALSNSKLTIAAPLPDKKLIGIEVGKIEQLQPVTLSDVLTDNSFLTSSPLTVPLGVDEFSNPAFINLARTPHLLIAGTTGSGKSTLLHTFITSLIRKNTPNRLRLFLVDPKQVEFATLYDRLPYLLSPVITETKKAVMALKWLNKEMERRFDILKASKCANITVYHEHVYEPAHKAWKTRGSKENELPNIPEPLPYIVTIFDEISDVMYFETKLAEELIVRITQMSRMVGIHLVIATSRPATKVISSAMKANIPTRIAFNMASYVESRTLLDQNGAETLLGSGDMLYLSNEDTTLRRYQGYFIESEDDIRKEVTSAIQKAHLEYEMLDLTNKPIESYSDSFRDSDDGDDYDELYEDAKQAVIEAGKASTSYIQRKLRIGYSRAALLIDLLEDGGVIGPADGSRPREIISKE